MRVRLLLRPGPRLQDFASVARRSLEPAHHYITLSVPVGDGHRTVRHAAVEKRSWAAMGGEPRPQPAFVLHR